MSGVNVPLYAKKPVDIKRWVRNTRAPIAQVQNLLAEMAGYAAYVRAPMRWRSPGMIYAAGASLIPTSQAAERERWHFPIHTSTYALYLWGRITLALQNAGSLADCYARVSLRSGVLATDTVLATADTHWGGYSGTPSDVPSEWADFDFVLANPADSSDIYEVTGETDYYLTVSELNYARIVSAELHEIALVPDTDNGYAPTNFADGSPIYDNDRAHVVSMARRTWKRHAVPLAHFHADTDTRSIAAAATARNPIDDSSTAVSAATPGYTLDMRNRTTLNRTSLGVPVEFRVYADGTDADTGTVKILDSSGTEMLSVAVDQGGPRWYLTQGYLPATLAKYDPRYGGNTLGALVLYDFTLIELDRLGDPVTGQLSATLDAITASATGIVENTGDLDTSIGDITLSATGVGASMTLTLTNLDVYWENQDSNLLNGVFQIDVTTVGDQTGVEVVLTIPRADFVVSEGGTPPSPYGSEGGLYWGGANVDCNASIANMLSSVELLLETRNPAWTCTAVDDGDTAGTFTLTFAYAGTLTAGSYSIYIADNPGEGDQTLLKGSFGTDGSPYDYSFVVQVAGSSDQVVAATGDTEVIYIGDLNVTATWDDADNTITEDTSTQFTISCEQQGVGQSSNTITVTLDTGCTTSSPTTVSNTSGWTIGSWTNPGGGTQWTATLTTGSIGSGNTQSVTFATTPSTAGTLGLSATATNSIGFSDSSGTDSLTVNAAASWTVDATSGIGTPLTEAEAEAVLTDAGVGSPNVTSLWKFGTPASGDVSDSIGAKTLTASGTWSYQQSVSGWSTKSMKSTAGTSGILTNTSFGNINANSYTVFLLAKTSVEGGTRSIFGMGDIFDDDACIEITSTPRLQVGEGDGTRTVGGSDPTGSTRWIVLRIDDTGNTVDGFTSQEKIIGGTQACNGTRIFFGGDNVQTWFPGNTDYLLAFITPVALTNTEIKAVLTSLGESPGWTP